MKGIDSGLAGLLDKCSQYMLRDEIHRTASMVSDLSEGMNAREAQDMLLSIVDDVKSRHSGEIPDFAIDLVAMKCIAGFRSRVLTAYLQNKVAEGEKRAKRLAMALEDNNEF
jgi:hypothetical protein